MSESTKMWAVVVVGHDDLFACTDRETADAAALLLNRQMARLRYYKNEPVHPWANARVIEWPYSAGSWEVNSRKFRMEIIEP